MPGFMEIQQGGWKVWGLIASTVLVLIGGGLTFYDNLSPGSLTTSEGKFPLKCSAQGCDWAEAISLKERQEWAQKEYENWKNAHPGQQPLNIDQLSLRDPFGYSGDQLSPEEMIEKRIIDRWGSYQDHLPFTCPKCGQATVYDAKQCKRCGDIFFPDYSKKLPEYPDTCPKCGYSEQKAHHEAAMEKLREQKK